jgi:hypothetical protein
MAEWGLGAGPEGDPVRRASAPIAGILPALPRSADSGTAPDLNCGAANKGRPPVSTAVETPPWPCHIVGMTDQAPPPYEFSRYRWNIRQIGTPIQSSMESFASRQEAHPDGRRVIERLTQVSRLGR